MIRLPESFKLAGWSYLNQILTLVAGLVQVKLLTHILSLDQYGAWAQVTVTRMLIGMVLAFNLGHGLIRMASGASLQGKHRYFITVLGAQCISYLCGFALAWPFRHKIVWFLSGAEGSHLYSLIFISALILIICTQFKNYLIITNRSLRMVQINGLNIALSAIFVCLFAWWGGSVDYALLGFIVAQGITALVLLPVLKLKWSWLRFDYVFLRTVAAFSIPLIVVSVSYWAINSSNRYLINYYMGRENVALFNVANRLPAMIVLIFTLMSSIFLSKISRMYEQKRYDDLSMWMNITVKVYLFLGISAAAGLVAGSRHITMLIADEVYLFDQLPLVYLFVALSSIMYGVFQIYSRLFELEKKVYRNGANWLLALVLNVVLNVVLIPRWGLVGAAFAMFVSVLGAFLLAMTHRFSFLDWSVKPFNYVLFGCLSLAAGYIFCLFVGPKLGIWMGLLASGLLAFIVAAAGLGSGLVSHHEIGWVWNRGK